MHQLSGPKLPCADISFSLEDRSMLGDIPWVAEIQGNRVLVLPTADYDVFLSQCQIFAASVDIVVSSELITAAGDLRETLDPGKILVANARMAELSLEFPNVKFLLGTVLWPEEESKPINCVAVFRDGEIIQAIPKTFLTYLEVDDFRSVYPVERNIVGMPGVELLICRDLVVTTGSNLHIRNELSGLGHAIQGDDVEAIISPEAKAVIISSCWGVGTRETWAERSVRKLVTSGELTVKDCANEFFYYVLREKVASLFHSHPKLEQVLVCDRIPLHVDFSENAPIVATMGMSGLYVRSDFNFI